MLGMIALRRSALLVSKVGDGPLPGDHLHASSGSIGRLRALLLPYA